MFFTIRLLAIQLFGCDFSQLDFSKIYFVQSIFLHPEFSLLLYIFHDTKIFTHFVTRCRKSIFLKAAQYIFFIPLHSNPTFCQSDFLQLAFFCSNSRNLTFKTNLFSAHGFQILKKIFTKTVQFLCAFATRFFHNPSSPALLNL